MSQVDQQLLEGFMQEALTLLDDAKDELASGECCADGVDAIFRCLHTLKGTSSFLDLFDFSQYVHKVEDFVRDKQEMKDGLNVAEAEALLISLDLMAEAVQGADDPEILQLPAYAEALQALSALRQEEGSLESFITIMDELKNKLVTKENELGSDTLLPAVTEIKALMVKLSSADEQQLGVDFRNLGKVMLAGKDVTEMVQLQLEVLEDLSRNGPADLFAKYDIVSLFSEQKSLQSDLTNGDKMLEWETLFDVYDTMPEVIDQAFAYFWEDGIALDAEITWREKASEKEAEVKSEANLSATETTVKTQPEKDEFFRVPGKILEDVAHNVGALVANRNTLENLVQEMGKHIPTTYRKHLKDSYTDLDHNVNNLEAKVSSLNNRRLKDVFQRLPSVVSKLADELGKNIAVELGGEDIEIPRSLVKSLNDPLVHIVRNSVDHGIETPTERESSGKPAQGNLAIMATRADDLLKISIKDDGKGLDTAKIRAKAISKGLITADDKLDDQAVNQMIFAAGFSTNEEVTSVSGRGVGMDVVRTTIESAGGRLQLSSTLGEGTVLDLFLPLDMGNQTRDVQLVELGDQAYGIEYCSLVEVMNVDDISLSSFQENNFFDYRGALLPFIDMGQFLNCVTDGQKSERIIIVEDEQQRRLACGVHGIKFKVKVVVSQFDHEFLKNNQTFTGTAVVGTGKPILVLNFRDISGYV